MQTNSSLFSANHQYGCSDKGLSRRSVDWRDSGIVIDEDHLSFNSFEAISHLNTPSSTLVQAHSGTNSQFDAGQPRNQSNPASCYPPPSIAFISQDDDGDTILHLAVVGFTLDKVRDLLKICDLDAINNMIQTPLHVATMANRPEMVKLLIDSKAKIDVHDSRGNTPLHLACMKGFKDIAIIILKALNDGRGYQRSPSAVHHIELANYDGQTCLHLAACEDKREIIELLVSQYNADLNCRDSRSGATIIHKAIERFNDNLVAFILGLEGQHCNQADYSGRRPLDIIRRLLESHLETRQVCKLEAINRLIKNRIKVCVEQNGCCANMQSSHEILDSSSSDSSSECSDAG